MKILEHANKKLILKPPQFKCDVRIVNRDIDPFENKAFFTTYVDWRRFLTNPLDSKRHDGEKVGGCGHVPLTHTLSHPVFQV